MLIVVGLTLAAVLSVVIPVGTSPQEPNWLLVTLIPAGLLALAGLYLYFWIVVLELFIKMGPLYYVDGNLYGSPTNNIPPPPVPMHAVPMIYGGQSTFFQGATTAELSNPQMGPQSMIYQPTQPIIYTQPQPHSYIQTSQQQQIYFQQIHQQQLQQQQQQQKSQQSIQ